MDEQIYIAVSYANRVKVFERRPELIDPQLGQPVVRLQRPALIQVVVEVSFR